MNQEAGEASRGEFLMYYYRATSVVFDSMASGQYGNVSNEELKASWVLSFRAAQRMKNHRLTAERELKTWPSQEVDMAEVRSIVCFLAANNRGESLDFAEKQLVRGFEARYSPASWSDHAGPRLTRTESESSPSRFKEPKLTVAGKTISDVDKEVNVLEKDALQARYIEISINVLIILAVIGLGFVIKAGYAVVVCSLAIFLGYSGVVILLRQGHDYRRRAVPRALILTAGFVLLLEVILFMERLVNSAVSK